MVAADAPARSLPEILQIAPDEHDAVFDLDSWAFAFAAPDELRQPTDESLEWDRGFAAWLEGPRRLAGVNLTYSAELPVPGARIPAAALTWVGVHPQDRRRGVLSAMISHHLHEVRRRGTEPVSVLFASEAPIYGRFGYGSAARHLSLTVPRGAALRPAPPGADVGTGLTVRMETLDADRHAEEVWACQREAGAHRPGWVVPPTLAARRRSLADPPSLRGRAEPPRLLTVRDGDGGLRGYAVFQRSSDWSEGGVPDGKVRIRELAALDPAAHRQLWQRLLDLDLTSTVVTPYTAVDDPLPTLLLDPRAAAPRLRDNLWCRVVDVPAALAARRYPAPLDLVLEVGDTLCPWNAGRWHLVGDLDGARCTPTDAEPTLRLDVRELGAAYLGGTSLAALAEAGLVRAADPGTLLRAAAGFGWPVTPFCAWEF